MTYRNRESLAIGEIGEKALVEGQNKDSEDALEFSSYHEW